MTISANKYAKPLASGLILVLIFLMNFSCVCQARGTLVKHLDINEIKKYEDSLSESDYQSLLEKARQVEKMIESGPPRTLDAREYEQAIQSVKEEARQKAEQRKEELEHNKSILNTEFSRISASLENAVDLDAEQKRSIKQKFEQTKAGWERSNRNQGQKVNQGLVECQTILEELKKINESLLNLSLTQKRPSSKNPLGNDSFIDPEHNRFITGEFVESTPDSGSDYGQEVFFSLLNYQDRGVNSRTEKIGNLEKRLQSLKNAGSIGTFEYESLAKRLMSIQKLAKDSCYSQEAQKSLDREIEEIQKDLYKVSGN